MQAQRNPWDTCYSDSSLLRTVLYQYCMMKRGERRLNGFPRQLRYGTVPSEKPDAVIEAAGLLQYHSQLWPINSPGEPDHGASIPLLPTLPFAPGTLFCCTPHILQGFMLDSTRAARLQASHHSSCELRTTRPGSLPASQHTSCKPAGFTPHVL